MITDNWSRFTKRIPVYAGVQQIYDAWTTQEDLEKWFLRKALFTRLGDKMMEPHTPIQTGDLYEWYWHGYDDKTKENGTITNANGKDTLQFSFAGNCLVTVQVKQEHGTAVVELTQENIPADDNPKTNLYVGCGEGWTFYLANLKSILESGVDLRNKNTLLTGVISS